MTSHDSLGKIDSKELHLFQLAMRLIRRCRLTLLLLLLCFVAGLLLPSSARRLRMICSTTDPSLCCFFFLPAVVAAFRFRFFLKAKAAFFTILTFSTLQWPNETAICPFVRRRMFGAQKCPNIRTRTNVRLRPNVRYFTEYSAILTNI